MFTSPKGPEEILETIHPTPPKSCIPLLENDRNPWKSLRKWEISNDFLKHELTRWKVNDLHLWVS